MDSSWRQRFTGQGDDRKCSVSKDLVWGNHRWPLQQPQCSKVMLSICERSSRRERGERTGAFLRDLEDYSVEFELHSAGNRWPLEVFVQSDDKTRII